MATSSRSKQNRHRNSNSITNLPKTEVTINVYDLLPPGRLSSILWTLGGSLLHSGVVISNKEYAFGGHNKPHTTGVYYTTPRYEPPGGTFRLSILQGFTYLPSHEIQNTIREVSDKFLGTSYNLLTYNCNHFTSALCEALTGKPAPGWVNRAASIGLALPCVVPKEWVAPPDVETAEGELLDEAGGEVEEEEEEEEYEHDAHEAVGMLESNRRRERAEEERQRRRTSRGIHKERGEASGTSSSGEEDMAGKSLGGGQRIRSAEQSPPPRLVSRKDSAGRDMPAAERAPLPKSTKT